MRNLLRILFGLSFLFSNLSFAAPSQPLLIGYWQNFHNPAEQPLRLTDIPNGYKIVNIAFGEMIEGGNVKFTLEGPPYDTMVNSKEIFKQDIKTLQARGVKVLLSLGGQNGYYNVNNPDQQVNFSNSLKQIITEYGFDGVDYDYESGLNTFNVTFLVNATKELKAYFANQKTLMFTAAPETIDVFWQVFPYGKYDLLIQSGLLDHVQVQLYNSGCMTGSHSESACYTQGTQDFIVSQADSTIQAWKKNEVKDAENKYVLGLPATQQAAGGGYTHPDVVKKALTCLRTLQQCNKYVPSQAYPTLGNLMTWSINWDAKNGYGFERGI